MFRKKDSISLIRQFIKTADEVILKANYNLQLIKSPPINKFTVVKVNNTISFSLDFVLTKYINIHRNQRQNS